ncbi:MAG: hypothetical protein AAF654_15235, partial [Myxococcota bacterium]
CRRRVEVEGSIGALKSGRYAFNRPNVRSTAMMLTAGQRSILGYNLNRLLHRTAEREAFQLFSSLEHEPNTHANREPSEQNGAELVS